MTTLEMRELEGWLLEMERAPRPVVVNCRSCYKEESIREDLESRRTRERQHALLKKAIREMNTRNTILVELSEAVQQVCNPIFTASDGGDMWCSMRNRPGASEAVTRLKEAIEAATVKP